MLILESSKSRLPTDAGVFDFHVFRDAQGREHAALSMGDVADGRPVLARVHSECLTGDAFGSRRCDCGAQLDAALHAIAAEGRGVLVYLRQEGRGIGLFHKARAYALQDEGADTVDANLRLGLPADAREYGTAVEILRRMGVQSVRLMTNNPHKAAALAAGGLAVERLAHEPPVAPESAEYLRTKRQRMGHLGYDSRPLRVA